MKYLLLFSLLCLSSLCAAQNPYNPGDTPFDLLGKNPQGEEIRISDFKGKLVIVSFWATWCGPCMQELPVLSSIQKSVGTEKLQVIAINYREDLRQFRKIAQAFKGYEMILVSDSRGKTGKKFGVNGIPHMVIVDREGKVAKVNIGFGVTSAQRLIHEIADIYNAGSNPLPLDEDQPETAID